jgi:hypothetical protein
VQVALQGLTGHETAKGTPTGTRTGPKVHGRDPDRGHELREGVCEAEPSTMQSSIFSKNVLVVTAVGGVFDQTCLERHVDLLPSGQGLAAAAVAKTVLWSVGRGCCLGRVFQDVFG